MHVISISRHQCWLCFTHVILSHAVRLGASLFALQAFFLSHKTDELHFWSVQLHNLPANYSELVVTGDDEGIFGVDASFLYALKPLDREKQPSYSLQVRCHVTLRHIPSRHVITHRIYVYHKAHHRISHHTTPQNNTSHHIASYCVLFDKAYCILLYCDVSYRIVWKSYGLST